MKSLQILRFLSVKLILSDERVASQSIPFKSTRFSDIPMQ